MNKFFVGLGLLFSFVFLHQLHAVDWPCYRGDNARTAMVETDLSQPMHVAWVYNCAQAPEPAWPDPIKESWNLGFDRSFVPVVSSGTLFFGSNADDSVRALDVETGSLKWQFYCGGPVRFAPAIADTRVFVTSDDGWIYCLDTKSGKVLWEFQAALNDDQVIGNGRMISRWPLRSGALVIKDTVYFTAGMWPSDGIVVYALNVKDGSVQWLNDTVGSWHQAMPHGGAYGITGIAPQGYLAASDEFLLVPTGRGVPAKLRLKDGKLVHFHGNAREGGAFCAIDTKTGILISGQGGRKNWRSISTGKRLGREVQAKCAPIDAKHISAGKIKIHIANGAVVASERNTEKWRCAVDSVEAHANGLAISDGKLFVSTSNGKIYCLKSGSATDPKIITEQRPAKSKVGKSTWSDRTLSLLKSQRITKGYALICGVQDINGLTHLAESTDLNIIVVPDAKSEAASLRKSLIQNTRLYGKRISVLESKHLSQMSFPSHFANAIIVLNELDAAGQKECYQLLRPYGGILSAPALSAQQAQSFMKAAGVPDNEIMKHKSGVYALRGKLVGAFDWNSKETCDQLVKWPLSLSWFGEPGPQYMVDRHFGAPAPLPAHGRVFYTGENHILAIDPYNGTMIWKRSIPQANAAPLYVIKNLIADDKYVYVDLGDLTYQLDAQTGEHVKVYGEFKPASRFDLSTPRQFKIGGEGATAGAITLEKTKDGLHISMASDNKHISHIDSWELYFDFRKPEQRIEMFGKGVFRIAVQAKTAQLRPILKLGTESVWDRRMINEKGGVKVHGGKGGKGNGHVTLPADMGLVQPSVTLEAAHTDKQAIVKGFISWEDIRSVTGLDSEEFCFAASLIYDTGKKGKKKGTAIWGKTYLFSDYTIGACNNGWAVFSINGKAKAGAQSPPTIASRAELPKWALEPARKPYRLEKPTKKQLNNPGMAFLARINPLFDKDKFSSYRRAYGCGGVAPSATMDFFRSGSLGFHDFTDDSGLRNFGGVRPSCAKTPNMIPALGMLVMFEGSAYCRCSYNFQTSLAMAPARKRSNEDWASYDDKAEFGKGIREIHANLGAPGDRRDDQGNLWLSSVRHRGEVLAGHLSMPFPVIVDGDAQFQKYRFNGDRRIVKNTEMPWVYASGFKDIRSIELPLVYYNPDTQAIVRPVAVAPQIDGKLSDTCWNHRYAVPLSKQYARTYLRADDTYLYIAYERRSALDLNGNEIPLRMAQKEDDSPVWKDDGLDLYFCTLDRGYNTMLHFAVSATGARYDGLIKPAKKLKSWAEALKQEHSSWNADDWKSAVSVNKNACTIEVAIPWSVIEGQGIKKEKVAIVFGAKHAGSQIFQTWKNAHALVFKEPSPLDKQYDVKLHFTEVDDIKAGDRIFSVKLQGKTVIDKLDIRAEAKSKDAALVKTFSGINGGESIRVEFTPLKGKNLGALLSGIEVIAKN